MPKLMTKTLSTTKPYKHIDLDPSKAWIRNLGAGTTRVMPKRKWIEQKSIKLVNRPQFKSAAMVKRPKYLANFGSDMNAKRLARQKRCDELPISNRVLLDYSDDTFTQLPHEYVQPSEPLHKLSIDLATFDFTPSASPRPGENQPNDTPSSLLLVSTDTESALETFTNIDKPSCDMCNVIDLVESKRSKLKCLLCTLLIFFVSFHYSGNGDWL